MVYYRLLEPPSLVEENAFERLDLQWRHADRLMDMWVLGLILSGEVGLCIGEERATVAAGQYYLMPPHVHHYGTQENEFTVIYFHFMAKCEICAQSDAGALPVYGAIPTHLKVADWFDFLRGSTDIGALNLEGWNLQLAALLTQLHLAARSDNVLSPTERLVLATIDYLRTHAQQPLSQSHLSSALGYSYDHLDRLFRKRFGLTIYRRHCELRFDHAVALLQNGHSVKEAGRAIGFDDYYHFLKAFKRERGYSPGQFFRQSR